MPRYPACPAPNQASLFDEPEPAPPVAAPEPTPVVAFEAVEVIHVGRARQSAPSVETICAHWQQAGTFPGVNTLGRYSLDPGQPNCFACGWWDEKCPDGCSHGLERAHAIPHANGGSDTDPGNYAMLCRGCHLEAPDTDDANYFWQWVAGYPECREPMWAGLRRFHRISEAGAAELTDQQRQKLEGLDLTTEQLRAATSDAMKRLRPVIHAGKFSDSTIQRLWVEALRTLAD